LVEGDIKLIDFRNKLVFKANKDKLLVPFTENWQIHHFSRNFWLLAQKQLCEKAHWKLFQAAKLSRHQSTHTLENSNCSKLETWWRKILSAAARNQKRINCHKWLHYDCSKQLPPFYFNQQTTP